MSSGQALFGSLVLHGALVAAALSAVRVEAPPLKFGIMASRVIPAPERPAPAPTEKTLSASTPSDAKIGQIERPPDQAAPSPKPGLPMPEPKWIELLSRIRRAVGYPPELARRRIQGRVRIRIRLAENGELLAAELAESSGHPELDRHTVEAIRSIGRFPGLRLPERARVVTVPVSYRL